MIIGYAATEPGGPLRRGFFARFCIYPGSYPRISMLLLALE
jgi:hypothetical protein